MTGVRPYVTGVRPYIPRVPLHFGVILNADLADLTRLVQQDEQLVHERILEAFRRFSETIGRYHGRVQELWRGALLAKLELASDAVMATLSFKSDYQEHLVKYKDAIQPKIKSKCHPGYSRHC